MLRHVDMLVRFSEDLSFHDGRTVASRVRVRHLDFTGANAVSAIQQFRLGFIACEPNGFILLISRETSTFCAATFDVQCPVISDWQHLIGLGKRIPFRAVKDRLCYAWRAEKRSRPGMQQRAP